MDGLCVLSRKFGHRILNSELWLKAASAAENLRFPEVRSGDGRF
jgi:hypothetical protein